MSGMILQSEKLKCECGAEQFLSVVTLLYSPSGGTTPQPSGYKCVQCAALVDIGAMVKRLKHAHLRAQMQEIATELGDGTVRSAAVAGDKS
jgi:hypothetical protein